MKVIVISGKAGSGKTFVAERLKDYIESNYDLKGYIINFGDPLKMVCQKVYGWDGSKGPTGRELLQRVGTDIAQANNKLVWVNIVFNIIEALRGQFDFVIIGDARFVHEVEQTYTHFIMKNDDVFAIKVLGKENTTLSEEQKNHPSETDLDNYSNVHYNFDNRVYDVNRFFHQLYLICDIIGF